MSQLTLADRDPNTDLDHKDPDNAGGNGNGKQNPDANGDIHGGKWSLAASLPFLLVPPESGTGIVDGQIVVRFKDGTSATDIQSAISAQSMTVLRSYVPKSYYVLQAPNGADERPILQYYAGLGSVDFVSPNTYVSPAAFTFDPFFQPQVQWPQVGLNEVCSSGTPTQCPGIADPAATDAWHGQLVGNFQPIVAVIDDGFDLNNPDIIPNLFINTDEVPQEIINNVGVDLNKDGHIDWRDLDADNDHVLTFADLDTTNGICGALQGFPPNSPCKVKTASAVCATRPCLPSSLVSGKGIPDPNRTTCKTSPNPLTGTWEDGVDGGNATSQCNDFIDDVIGWNFNCRDGKGNPITVAGTDGTFTGCNRVTAATIPNTPLLTHGTTVASIIGAAGGNGMLGVGVNWNVRILPVQLLATTLTLPTSIPQELAFRDSLDSASFYAALHVRADVINMSLVSYGVIDGVEKTVRDPNGLSACPGNPTVTFPANKSQLFTDFSDQLRAEGALVESVFAAENQLVVIAAGNCDLDLDDAAVIAYPQTMKGSNVIHVGSVGSNTPNRDHLSIFSNYGGKSVEIAAPGEFFDVAVTIGPGSSGVVDLPTFCQTDWDAIEGEMYGSPRGCIGTSFAAPMVAGAAALLLADDSSLSQHPCEMADRLLRNAATVVLDPDPNATTNTTHPIGSARRLDIRAAVANTNSTSSCP